MNYLIGVIKILISLCCFVLGIAFVFVIGDAYKMNYPDYAKILIPLAFVIIINNGIFIMKEGVREIKKKNLTLNYYTFVSIGLIYLSLITTIVLTLFSLRKNTFLYDKRGLVTILAIGLIFLLVAIYDSIKIKKTLPNTRS